MIDKGSLNLRPNEQATERSPGVGSSRMVLFDWPKKLEYDWRSPLARGKFSWWLFTPDGSFLYLMASQSVRKDLLNSHCLGRWQVNNDRSYSIRRFHLTFNTWNSLFNSEPSGSLNGKDSSSFVWNFYHLRKIWFNHPWTSIEIFNIPWFPIYLYNISFSISSLSRFVVQKVDWGLEKCSNALRKILYTVIVRIYFSNYHLIPIWEIVSRMWYKWRMLMQIRR